MSQAYYRKWRPQRWDEVVAQEHVIQTLRNAVRTGHTGHAYLFAGPRGTGKTTTARLLAKALNCLDPDPANRPCDACPHCRAIDEGRFLDLIEIDAASNTSVDDVRDLREKINFSPTQGAYKVYIIDEVHMLSTAAFNALLKTLEEPPSHAVFVLATTEVHKIPATILSRVQRFEFRRIPVKEIFSHLKRMAAEENIAVEDDALLFIARQATGAMRDAISLLDQLASSGERVTLQEAQSVLGAATSSLVIDLVEAVLAQDAGQGMRVVHDALDGGADSRQFGRQVVEYLRSLLLVKMGNAASVDATAEMRQEMAAAAQRFEPLPRLLDAIRAFNSAAVDARSSWQPALALELAVAETAAWEEQADSLSAGGAEKKPALSAASQASAPLDQPPAVPFQPAAAQEQAPSPAASASPRAETAQLASSAPTAGREPSRSASPSAAESQAAPRTAPKSGAEQAAPSRVIAHADVQQNWERIRAMVKQRNQYTEAALNSGRYLLKDSHTLVLSYSNELLKSKMETEENLKILREVLQSILGVRLNVKCVLAQHMNAQPSDPGIDGDGIVGTALNLGGKIVSED